MKKILSIFIVLLFASSLATNAQRPDHSERWEKFRAEKIAFLTANLDLTPSEAQKFWPVYNQLEKEKWEAQMQRRDMEHKVTDAEESLSEKEIIKLTRDFSGSMQKEAGLMVKYNEEFLKILPPQKVLKLYKTENEFRMHMIQKYRGQHGRDKKN